MSQIDSQKLNQFIAKVDAMKKQEKLDLSADQDLSIAVMNLVSIEEHFFFSGAKTGNNKYYDLIREVREMRKQLLKKLVQTNDDSEKWCISKHLLAASMRLMEVGTKQLGMDRKSEAYDLFDKSFQLYSLFWGLNMKLIDVAGVKKIDEGALNKHDQEKKGFMGKLSGLVKKLVDCCIE